MRNIITILFITLTLGACNTPKQLSQSPIATSNPIKLDHYIQSQIDSILDVTNIPSMVISIIKPDTILYGINGLVKTDSTERVNLKSKYHLGSNSKAITALIAMKIIEDKKIELTTKFTDVYPDSSIINSTYKDITLDDLLSHRAKVQPFMYGIEYLSLPPLEGSISERRKKFCLEVCKRDPVTSDKTYNYSNAGYAMAAAMLELKAGIAFEEILASTMESLEMEHTNGFANKEDESHPWGHWIEKDELIATGPDHEYKLENYMISAGDISMNIEDYATFIQMNLNGLLGKDNYLRSESYEQLHYGQDEYAYGWSVYEENDKKISTHDGSIGTFYCHTSISPSDKYAIVIMTNSALQDHIKSIYAVRKNLMQYFQN